MITNAHHIHMVALLLAYSNHVCRSESRAYKVKESNEEYDQTDYTKDYQSLSGNSGSGGDASGFHFPDFFNDGRQDGGNTGFGLTSPFEPSFPLQSRSSDSSGKHPVPAGTLRTGSSYNKNKPRPPYTNMQKPRNYDYQNGRAILSLYDDWTPEQDQARHSWSQQHDDDDSSEVSHSHSKPQPYTGGHNHKGPYSEASLKQHYKPIRPVGKTYGTNYAPVDTDINTSVHQHKYGVSHIHEPKKKPETPNYDAQNDESYDEVKPRPYNKKYSHKRPQERSSYFSDFPSHNWGGFKSSPTDSFLNSRRNYDFFSSPSNIVPKKAVTPKPHKQLDKSCVKKPNPTTINISDERIVLDCYECKDEKHSRLYEQCVQVSNSPKKTTGLLKRFRRDLNKTEYAEGGRGKRQHSDYYDGNEGNYGQNQDDYRFGPEHFVDDYPSTTYDVTETDEAEPENQEQDSEICQKSKKGDMVCISCENKNTGGTYEQCSYASDPKKNSYERSISKVYGSPRLPSENRRKQIESASYPKRPQNYVKKGTYQSDERSVGPSNPDPVRYHPKPRHRPPNGQSPDNRYSRPQGKSQRPPRNEARSVNRTPASTQLRGPNRQINSRNAGNTGNIDTYKYSVNHNPPPASRAYSTPSPLGPDPYAYNMPDPYSPRNVHLAEDDEDIPNSPSSKNDESSFEPGYDETFASLFPELADSDPIALAPAAYDEYADEDYDEGPEQRKDGVGQYSATSDAKVPAVAYSRNSGRSKSSTQQKEKPHKKKSSCKTIKKNKMTCLNCVDEDGRKHEECSYITSEAESKRPSYHEPKDTRYDNRNENPNQNRGQLKEHHKDENHNFRGKRKYKKYDASEHKPPYMDIEKTRNQRHEQPPKENYERFAIRSRDHYNTTLNHRGRSLPTDDTGGEVREKREDTEKPEGLNSDSNKQPAIRPNYNPIPTDPTGFANLEETISEAGEFDSDTEMQFDPELGFSLPKYMLDKSEHEAIFDDVLTSGK